MFTSFEDLKSLARGAALALLPLIAACGGGGGDESSADNVGPGTNPIACIIVILASGQTDCIKGDSSSKPSSLSQAAGTADSQAASSITNSAPVLQGNQEFESNDELANANLPASAARSSADTQIGWYLAGSIDDIADTRDAFAFTPERTSAYAIALCPPEGSSCDESAEIDTLTAFFRVLDQDGKVLLTSQADTDEGNSHQTTFDAGVLYYVTVEAGDTMGVKVDYRLFVYEK